MDEKRIREIVQEEMAQGSKQVAKTIVEKMKLHGDFDLSIENDREPESSNALGGCGISDVRADCLKYQVAELICAHGVSINEAMQVLDGVKAIIMNEVALTLYRSPIDQ